MWWVAVKKGAKNATSGIRDAEGRCRLPVYVGKRGAPKGNRNAERDGFHNREAKAQRAQYSAVLKSARGMMMEAKLLLQEMRIEKMRSAQPSTGIRDAAEELIGLSWRTPDAGEADQDRHDSDHNRYDVPHESPNSPKCGQPLQWTCTRAEAP